MNILELPLEVLKMIISFVPDQMTLAQTCKTFYEISCRLKCYKTEVRSWGGYPFCPGINIKELEENELLLESIVNSERKINEITLFCSDVSDLKCHGSFKMLFERFGRDLVELKIIANQLFEPFENSEKRTRNFQLDLPNLRVLSIKECHLSVLNMFNNLPDNVLNKVCVHCCKGNVENVFRNQRNIKNITWYNSGPLVIETKNLQLLSLELDNGSYSRELLKGQGSLLSLTLLLGMKQDDIEMISTLEHLENLELQVFRFVNLSSLQKLKMLKKLHVFQGTRDNRSVDTLKSSSVTNLTVSSYKNDRDFAVTLSLNCPNIRKLTLGYEIDFVYSTSEGSTFLSSILENFQNIETLATSLPDNFTFPSGVIHRNLKRLHMEFILPRIRLNPLGLQTLLESFVSLETYETTEIDSYLLETLLTAQPNLNFICVGRVEDFDEKFINTFWALGRNVESFHIRCISVGEVEKMIKEKMQEIYGGPSYLALMKAMKGRKTCCKITKY